MSANIYVLGLWLGPVSNGSGCHLQCFAAHVGPVQVPDALLLIPINVPGKPVEDRHSSWAPSPVWESSWLQHARLSTGC